VYKKGVKMSVSNWRPITLLCAFYTLFTACLDRFLHAHGKLFKAQAPGASLFSRVTSAGSGLEAVA
jgi:hypothetical protein